MKNKQQGQVILEAALILPIFIFIGLGLIDLQWMLSRASTVDYIAYETARCEAIGAIPCSSPNTATSYAQQQATSLRMDLEKMEVVAPACSPAACVVQLSYSFKPVGIWFPAVKIRRTGMASVTPTPE